MPDRYSPRPGRKMMRKSRREYAKNFGRGVTCRLCFTVSTPKTFKEGVVRGQGSWYCPAHKGEAPRK